MSSSLVECVPNISEGRDLVKIKHIVDAAAAIDGCHVLGVEPDHDYHRTVITLAGEPQAVKTGAVALIRKAISTLDMREHKGEHPRLGVVDVCPFVPLKNISMEACAELAKEVVNEVASLEEVPLFLYGAAASHPQREVLSALRRGEYEGLESRLAGKHPKHDSITIHPDAGSMEWSETVARSGGITVGARPILVAYNVNLDEQGAEVAKKVGSLVRSSGRLIKSPSGQRIRTGGMLTKVQGMGVDLEEHGISQVSMNLIDVELCPLHMAYETVKSVAGDHGVGAAGSELVGLVPLDAMLKAGKFYASDLDEEAELVAAAVEGLGLNRHHTFNPQENIIEWALKKVSQ